MHRYTLDRWRRPHDFVADSSTAERRTRYVIGLTAAMMLVEIAAGVLLGSMALLADGWHMATHVAAFGITLFAYRYARRHSDDPRFSFGTGKVSSLGGFASAVALAVVAGFMALESVARVFEPHAIRFDEALAVAALGLAVNVVSGLLLGMRGDGDHADHHAAGHTDRHHHHHHAHHHDHNLRAAYLHVLADALTSVFAIVALLAGKYLGLAWLDPVMGLVGAAVIAHWSLGLMRASGLVLLDGSADEPTRRAIVSAIEDDADNRIADLHVWQVGTRMYSAEIALVTHHPRPPDHYKRLLAAIPGLAHVMVEVNPCSGPPCSD